MQQADSEPVYSVSTKAGLKADPDTLVRVAPISKIVTGYVVLAALRRMGLDPSLPLDVNGILGFRGSGSGLSRQLRHRRRI